LGSYIENIKEKDELIVTGTSCRKQFLDVFRKRSKHLPQLFFGVVKE
jgi:hypothetical protein